MEARVLRSDTLAPWAEIVPGVGPMTVDDLLRRPDDSWRYEVVEGVLVRMARSAAEATEIAMRLGGRLSVFADDHNVGVVIGADGVYDFENAGQKNTGLIPDVGFYDARRRPRVEPDKALPFAPDLAVEAVLPSQDVGEMAAKVRRYLKGGTALVWVIWPKTHRVDVWRAGDAAPSTVLGDGDLFDGENVVPGFTYPVGRLFA